MELSITREATVVQPLDSFPAFYGTRKFITACTTALHLSLSIMFKYILGSIRNCLWLPDVERPRVADGRDGLRQWRAAANILNKQPRTNDKGWSSSLGVGRGANNPSP
jgi:hypothetical protein